MAFQPTLCVLFRSDEQVLLLFHLFGFFCLVFLDGGHEMVVAAAAKPVENPMPPLHNSTNA